MEIISRISKGSKMDQVYIPKNRNGFGIGDYVVVKEIEKSRIERPFFYNIDFVEPVKLEIIKEIIKIIDKNVKNENVIITGSFLDKGFCFNDVDVIVVSEEKKNIEKLIIDKLKIKVHVLFLNNKELKKGLEIDPLYQMMLSRCIAKKRFIYNIKSKINYKILDLYLLKSKVLVDNFDFLDGNEKYYLIRNLVAIYLYLENKKIGKEKVDKEIERKFEKIEKIKKNMLEKTSFLKKFKKMYDETFERVMDGINGS
ncbi:hypothetical protein CL618_00975 [archaeon]|nr:hypothetical protein [archaeon]|tara:strand:+ start:1084 stop:1848 length:765 start_codon:yes stop_codon:yes gene_type:complete